MSASVLQFDSGRAHNFRLIPGAAYDVAHQEAAQVVQTESKELKYCETCTRLFTRTIKVTTDREGNMTRTGPKHCSRCQVTENDPLAIEARKALRPTVEAYREEKDAFPKRGVAKDKKVITIQGRRRASWRQPLIDAFIATPQMTSREIGAVMGITDGNVALKRLYKAKFELKVVGHTTIRCKNARGGGSHIRNINVYSHSLGV